MNATQQICSENSHLTAQTLRDKINDSTVNNYAGQERPPRFPCAGQAALLDGLHLDINAVGHWLHLCAKVADSFATTKAFLQELQSCTGKCCSNMMVAVLSVIIVTNGCKLQVIGG